MRAMLWDMKAKGLASSSATTVFNPSPTNLSRGITPHQASMARPPTQLNTSMAVIGYFLSRKSDSSLFTACSCSSSPALFGAVGAGTDTPPQPSG
eukprot:CAMPEP_0173262978 /NCGR_PEP_ID=MMETSP1142-20121109/27090_1 /TAXON_ID=483371 /ORGANISM="non described non described, Strain CCMP2298" /LENGTH=94 /DNA_ID=CAMNT_0014198207 /DNA_START=261 /DNA_END=546 /DNA_ORIENTATION=-